MQEVSSAPVFRRRRGNSGVVFRLHERRGAAYLLTQVVGVLCPCGLRWVERSRRGPAGRALPAGAARHGTSGGHGRLFQVRQKRIICSKEGAIATFSLFCPCLLRPTSLRTLFSGVLASGARRDVGPPASRGGGGTIPQASCSIRRPLRRREGPSAQRIRAAAGLVDSAGRAAARPHQRSSRGRGAAAGSLETLRSSAAAPGSVQQRNPSW
jgi:hypothetical protein